MSILLSELETPSSIERRRARVALIEMGTDAIGMLAMAASSPHQQVKLEAIKALEVIGGIEAGRVLVRALNDNDFKIRWLAAEALTQMGHSGLKPVLEALIQDDGLSWVRQGARYVLHFYKGELSRPLEQLLSALDDEGVGATVTWDAGVALRSLESETAQVLAGPQR
jgi:HEAT repeat protein